MTDRERLLQTLAATYAYYERELTQFAVKVWLEDLADLPIDAVCAAFVAHRRDPQRGQWLPKSADILRQIRGDIESDAHLAWGDVMRIACNGGRGEVDAVTLAAVKSLGGISVIQHAKPEQNQWLQKRFLEAYAVYARREQDQPALLGNDAQKLVESAAKKVTA